MKFRYYLFVGAFFCALQTYAQQVPHFTMYMFNGTLLNPAHINKSDYADVAIFYRRQWTGFPGAPETKAASINMPMQQERMTLGANIIQGTLGASSLLHARVNYSYRLQLSQNSILALGLTAGVYQYKLDADQLNLYHDIDSDPVFSQANSRFLMPDVGFGAIYKTPKYLVALSIPHLMPLKLSAVDAQLTRHYFLMGSYCLPISREVTAVPSVLLKMVQGAPAEVDLNTNFMFYDRFWAGMTYRTGDAVAAQAGIKFANPGRLKDHIFRLGYAFDLTTSGLSPYNSGTHEVMLTYSFRAKSAVNCPGDREKLKTYGDCF